VVLDAEVDVRGSGGVKIAEVIEATFGDAQLAHRAVRTELGRVTMDGRLIGPLELAGLRTPRTPAPVEEMVAREVVVSG